MLSYFQFAKKVLLHLCPAAGYLAYKKYHNLQMCTRPTCRGILCGVIRKQNIFQTEVFFSNLQTCKYTLFKKFVNSKKILPVGTRLDISLKKLPRPSNLHTTYLSRYAMRWYSQKNIFQPEEFFFQLSNL